MKTSVYINKGPLATSSISIQGSRTIKFKDSKTHSYLANFINDMRGLFLAVDSSLKLGATSIWTYDRDFLMDPAVSSGLNVFRAYSTGLKIHATALGQDGNLYDPFSESTSRATDKSSKIRLAYSDKLGYFVTDNVQRVATSDLGINSSILTIYDFLQETPASVLISIGRTSSTNLLIHLNIFVIHDSHRHVITSMGVTKNFRQSLDDIQLTDSDKQFKKVFNGALRLDSAGHFMHAIISDRQLDLIRSYAQFRSIKQFKLLSPQSRRGPMYKVLFLNTITDFDSFVLLYTPLAASTGLNSIIRSLVNSKQADLVNLLLRLRLLLSSKLVNSKLAIDKIILLSLSRISAEVIKSITDRSRHHRAVVRNVTGMHTKRLELTGLVSKLLNEIRQLKLKHLFLGKDIGTLSLTKTSLVKSLGQIRSAHSGEVNALRNLHIKLQPIVKTLNLVLCACDLVAATNK